jgi:pSer/pThr/pTyr-binding forkhead associated (FHA) protein
MNLLRRDAIETTTVRLVLATGSRAGLIAPLQLGYYMIGRHQECQIRPKSRSVSRRHCLLDHQDIVRVMDLGSTSGTEVNERRLVPHVWQELHHGDMLRCGRILFLVSIDEPEQAPRNSSTANVAHAVNADDSLMRGQAWQADQVSQFLESEDERAREQRYESIRSKNRQQSLDDESDAPASDIETEVDLDELAADFSDEAVIAQTKAKSAKRTQLVRNLKAKKRHRKISGNGLSVLSSATRGDWRLLAAVALAVTFTGLATYKAYQIYTGPATRVIQSID